MFKKVIELYGEHFRISKYPMVCVPLPTNTDFLKMLCILLNDTKFVSKCSLSVPEEVCLFALYLTGVFLIFCARLSISIWVVYIFEDLIEGCLNAVDLFLSSNFSGMINIAVYRFRTVPNIGFLGMNTTNWILLFNYWAHPYPILALSSCQC